MAGSPTLSGSSSEGVRCGLPTIHPEQSTRNVNQWLLDERLP